MHVRSRLCGAVLLCALAVVGCSSDDGKGNAAASPKTTTATTASEAGGEPSISTEDNERIQCTAMPQLMSQADDVVAQVEAGTDPSATAISARVPWVLLSDPGEDVPQSITQYTDAMAEVMRQIKDGETADVDSYHQAADSLRKLCGL